MHDQSWLWHRRLGHANMDLISQLNKNKLVRGRLKIIFKKIKACEACQLGKQIKNSFKNKNFISITRQLELLHMDLFGPSKTPSLGEKSYGYVIVKWAHSLMVISRVLHHMLCFIFLPWGGHRDEVSYYKAFLIDSILTRRQIHLGYLMMMHMIACCENTTRVFPYGRYLSWVFKDKGINLSKETEFEVPNTYETLMISLWGGWHLRRLQMVLGLEKQKEHNHGDRDRHTLELRKRQRLDRWRVE